MIADAVEAATKTLKFAELQVKGVHDLCQGKEVRIVSHRRYQGRRAVVDFVWSDRDRVVFYLKIRSYTPERGEFLLDDQARYPFTFDQLEFHP